MRPEARLLYSKDWPEISRRTISAKGRLCEECIRRPGIEDIILTVHHIDYNPANNDPRNLIVLCQGCHLRRQGRELKEATKYHKTDRLLRMGQLPFPGLLPILPKTVYRILASRVLARQRKTPGHALLGNER